MEPPDRQTIIFEASKRFDADNQVRQELTGNVETGELKDQLCRVPGQFISAIAERSQSVGRVLLSGESGAWQTVIIPTREESDGPGSSLAVTDIDAGVVYRRYRGGMMPSLFVTTKSIHDMSSKAEILFYREQQAKAEQTTAEAAIVMSGWYAMGQWMIDKLDPRNDDFQGSEPLVMHNIAKIAKKDPESMMDETELDGAILISKFRVAGAMVYAGLARYLDQSETSEARDANRLQGIIRNLYQLHSSDDPAKTSVLDFALAHAAGRDEIGALFDAYSA